MSKYVPERSDILVSRSSNTLDVENLQHVHSSHIMSEEVCEMKDVLVLRASDPNSLEERAAKGTPPKRFRCETCHKVFSQKGNMERHAMLHSGPKQFRCDVCSKLFRDNSHLERHRRVHSEERSYQCEVCTKTFSQKEHLKRFRCETCHKMFSQKGNMERHAMLHSGMKQFRCDVCNKLFRDKCHLERHWRVHSKERPYQCEVCAKTFSQKEHLKQHAIVHTDEMPFQCDLCDRYFKYKHKLNLHRLAHTRPPLECPVCKKTFSHRGNMKQHALTHMDPLLDRTSPEFEESWEGCLYDLAERQRSGCEVSERSLCDEMVSDGHALDRSSRMRFEYDLYNDPAWKTFHTRPPVERGMFDETCKEPLVNGRNFDSADGFERDSCKESSTSFKKQTFPNNAFIDESQLEENALDRLSKMRFHYNLCGERSESDERRKRIKTFPSNEAPVKREVIDDVFGEHRLNGRTLNCTDRCHENPDSTKSRELRLCVHSGKQTLRASDETFSEESLQKRTVKTDQMRFEYHFSNKSSDSCHSERFDNNRSDDSNEIRERQPQEEELECEQLDNHPCQEESKLKSSSSPQCHLCHESSRFDRGLEFHHLLHAKEKPFKCELCNRCFSYRCSLANHNCTNAHERLDLSWP